MRPDSPTSPPEASCGRPASRLTPSAGATGGREKPLRILVAEDDAVIGMLLGRILAALGHEVCAVVATEAAAVAAAADRLPDLMVVDVNLACGSGQGAVDAINRLQVIPYVFTTGNALALQRERPEAVVIQKPFDEAQLTAAMARALAGS